MSATTILPCPFCGDGDPAIDEVATGVWALLCNGCGCPFYPVNECICSWVKPEEAACRAVEAAFRPHEKQLIRELRAIRKEAE